MLSTKEFSEKSFKLFANCIPVDGYARSAIFDLHRQKIHFIPNLLYEILDQFDGSKIKDAKSYLRNKYKEYDQEHDQIIEDYFDFLYENELIFFTDQSENFPPLSLDWDSPHKITNATIEIDNDFNDDLYIINQLDGLGCQAIQLRFIKEMDFSILTKLLDQCSKKRMKSIELIFNYQEKCNKEWALSLCSRYQRLTSLTLLAAPFENREKFDIPKAGKVLLRYSKISCNNEVYKETKTKFYPNIQFFTEAKNFNAYLNRKVCIDRNGDIKNCLTSDESFGNIAHDRIEDIVTDDRFTKYWNITKDEVETCRDCELRYVCCNYEVNKDKIYSKPNSCEYDPYESHDDLHT